MKNISIEINYEINPPDVFDAEGNLTPEYRVNLISLCDKNHVRYFANSSRPATIIMGSDSYREVSNLVKRLYQEGHISEKVRVVFPTTFLIGSHSVESTEYLSAMVGRNDSQLPHYVNLENITFH